MERAEGLLGGKFLFKRQNDGTIDKTKVVCSIQKKGHRRKIHMLKQYIPSQLRAGQFGLFCLRNGRTMALFISARFCIFSVFKFKTTTCIFMSSSNEYFIAL